MQEAIKDLIIINDKRGLITEVTIKKEVSCYNVNIKRVVLDINRSGLYPFISSYKNFWGRTIERDALRQDDVLWYWLDTNNIIFLHTDSLNAFYNMQGVTFYVVNGS